MAELETKTYEQIVTDQATATQSAATRKMGKLLNFAVGATLRALVESNAGLALWLQGLLVKTLAVTRLATSEGDDVDTFIGDFGLVRSPASKASGNVTFSRNISDNDAVIELGQEVQDVVTTFKYAVIADTTNPLYDPSTETYTILAGSASGDVKVEAVIAGSSGNASEKTITVISQPIQYVDFVSNALPFVNGFDEESDEEARQHFIDYINSLSKATKLAIEEAIESVQEGIQYGVVENKDYTTGLEKLGYFYAVIDDGSGSPPPELLSSVAQVVDRVRGFTTYFEIKAANASIATVSGIAKIDITQYDADTVKEAVDEALLTYISALGINTTLYYTRLIQIIYDAHPAIQDVTAVLLNGGTADLVSDEKSSIQAGTIVITVVSI